MTVTPSEDPSRGGRLSHKDILRPYECVFGSLSAKQRARAVGLGLTVDHAHVIPGKKLGDCATFQDPQMV